MEESYAEVLCTGILEWVPESFVREFWRKAFVTNSMLKEKEQASMELQGRGKTAWQFIASDTAVAKMAWEPFPRRRDVQWVACTGREEEDASAGSEEPRVAQVYLAFGSSGRMLREAI